MIKGIHFCTAGNTALGYIFHIMPTRGGTQGPGCLQVVARPLGIDAGQGAVLDGDFPNFTEKSNRPW